MGKKLVAAHDLKKGMILSELNIAIKSPGGGIPPYEIDNVIGLTLKQDLKKDENINFDFLKV
jgi:N-acetylneuraminate synthase/sialic acid synthase